MDGSICVIGSGTIGSMVLWRLSQLTAGVVGFEALEPGSDSTGVGGDTRMFRMAYREGTQYQQLLNDSEVLWNELNELTDAHVLDQRHGALTISRQESGFTQDLLNNAHTAGAAHELLSLEDLKKRFPQHHPLVGDVGLFDPRGGVLRTDLAVLTAKRQAERSGVTVISNTAIERVVPRKGYVEVHSGEQSWSFEKVVIAGGAWSKDLLPNRYSDWLKIGRILLTWYVAKHPGEFAGKQFPPFMRDSGGLHMWGAPSIDGSTVKIGGIIPPQEVRHMTVMDRSLSQQEIRSSNEVVSEFLPGLIPSCVRSKAYPDLYTADGHPMIGWLPDMPGVFLATGFSGKGFKMASGVGEAVAQSVVGMNTSDHIDFANPRRFFEDQAVGTGWGRLTTLDSL